MKKQLPEWLFEHSPRKEKIDKIYDLIEMLSNQGGKNAEDETVSRYRVLMTDYLFSLSCSVEFLFRLVGFLSGLFVALLLTRIF